MKTVGRRSIYVLYWIVGVISIVTLRGTVEYEWPAQQQATDVWLFIIVLITFLIVRHFLRR